MFFRLAWRLPAYQGAVRQTLAAQLAEDQEDQQDGQWTTRAPGETPAPAQSARMVPGTRGALSMDTAFKGIFSFGTAGKPKGGSG